MTRHQMLEELYAEARKETLLGCPVMEIPTEKVFMDDKGRTFVDLRLIIDQLQLFISKAE